ncbi:MAG: DUF3419 family protein [Sandaracinus sp.]
MSTRVGGALRDIARGTQDLVFRHTFQELFVYNILFEDSEVDEQVLALDEQSDVLAISGAGCGVAAMISRAPRSIDAIDLNGHHLALAALKVEAPRRLQRYGAFYAGDLMGADASYCRFPNATGDFTTCTSTPGTSNTR